MALPSRPVALTANVQAFPHASAHFSTRLHPVGERSDRLVIHSGPTRRVKRSAQSLLALTQVGIDRMGTLS